MRRSILSHAGFLFALFVLPVFAQAKAEYSVAPLIIDVGAESRDILTKEITIKNTGEQPVTVFPTVNNISLAEGGGIQEFLPPVESDRTASLASWIEVSRRGINIRPGESATVPVTFRINYKTVPGTYHAFIGFGNGRNQDEAVRQVEAGQAPGTVVNVTIEKKTNEFLRLSKFIVERFVTAANNQAAVYTFTNPGDEAVTPKGEIIFYDSTGKEVGNVSVNSEKLAIPPGGEHVFSAPVPVDGLFGKYKAFLSVEYGSERASVQDTSFFYIFPVKNILIALVLLILLVGGVAWHVHRRYLDAEVDDSDRLTLHYRETPSVPQHHDIDLTRT